MFAKRTDDTEPRAKWSGGFRTPLAHRFGHRRPKDCSRATGGYSTILPRAGVGMEDKAQDVFDYVHHNFDPSCLRRCKERVSEWLEARHFGDARMIPATELEQKGRKHCAKQSCGQAGRHLKAL